MGKCIDRGAHVFRGVSRHQHRTTGGPLRFPFRGHCGVTAQEQSALTFDLDGCAAVRGGIKSGRGIGTVGPRCRGAGRAAARAYHLLSITPSRSVWNFCACHRCAARRNYATRNRHEACKIKRFRKASGSRGAVSSVVEHFLDTEGVRGSNPLSRTIPPLTRALGVSDVLPQPPATNSELPRGMHPNSNLHPHDLVTAIDIEHLAGDGGGAIAGQKHSRGAQLVR
jgi:hypothetical protein